MGKSLHCMSSTDKTTMNVHPVVPNVTLYIIKYKSNITYTADLASLNTNSAPLASLLWGGAIAELLLYWEWCII